MNILISKLCNFPAAGRIVSKGSQERVPRFVRLLQFLSLLATHFVNGAQTIEFEWRHFLRRQFIDVKREAGRRNGKKFFNYFFISLASTLPGNLSPRVVSFPHNRITFDIYYKETKAKAGKCVHKLVINNLLHSIAYITIAHSDLWRSLSHFEWK